MIERVEAARGLRPRAAWRVPWTLLIFLAALILPWVGSRYDTFIGTQIAIYSLFAMSLNLLLGTTGLVSFGHAAYFGIGSYGCGILMKMLGVPFWLSFPAAGLIAAAFAVVFGFFCVRLTKIYFAMLTLAFAQIVWAICFKWNDLTGGDQGLPDVPFPDLAWLGSLLGFQRFRIGLGLKLDRAREVQKATDLLGREVFDRQEIVGFCHLTNSASAGLCFWLKSARASTSPGWVSSSTS